MRRYLQDWSKIFFGRNEQSEFMESFNTTNCIEPFNTTTFNTDIVEDLKSGRTKKLKKNIEKGSTPSHGSLKGEMTHCICTFTKVATSLMGTRKETNNFGSIKTAVEILNNMEGVEVASPFWINATEVLENETKRMFWLTMRKAARMSWMIKQVEKMS